MYCLFCLVINKYSDLFSTILVINKYNVSILL